MQRMQCIYSIWSYWISRHRTFSQASAAAYALEISRKRRTDRSLALDKVGIDSKSWAIVEDIWIVTWAWSYSKECSDKIKRHPVRNLPICILIAGSTIDAADSVTGLSEISNIPFYLWLRVGQCLDWNWITTFFCKASLDRKKAVIFLIWRQSCYGFSYI